MKTTIEFSDCRDCPYRESSRGHGECWEECGHPKHGRGSYENILYGCQEKFTQVPEWCPIKSPN